MRKLVIDNTAVDIDDSTAIGITYQTYDVESPGQKFSAASNRFSIPATSRNLALFGFPGTVAEHEPKVYGTLTANYYIDNLIAIKGAKVRFDKVVKGRISMTLFEKSDIWDTLKSVSMTDFTSDYLIWLNANYSVPIGNDTNVPLTNPAGTDLGDLIDFINQAGSPLHLSKFHNPFNQATSGDYSGDQLFMDDYRSENLNGGSICSYLKPIFEYIEDTYNISFYTGDATISNNIFLDSFANSIYVPIRDLATGIRFVIAEPLEAYHYFKVESNPNYYNLDDAVLFEDKTLYDLINSFFQLLNIAVTPLETDTGLEGYTLTRFDDISVDDAVNWSGKLSSISDVEHTYMISGLAKNNYIKFSSIYEGGSDFYNSKNIQCSNSAISYESDLFTIDAYAAGLATLYSREAIDLSKADSFETFTFLIDDTLISSYTIKSAPDGTTGIYTATRDIYDSALVSIASEYTLLSTVFNKPVIKTAEIWLTFFDMLSFRATKPIYIKELGGTYYANKISGFNPEKSKKPTKVELIKIGTAVPASAL